MPEFREKVAALREGGEMPEDWAEQLRDFYLPACLNCGGISDFEFTTDAFGGLCGSEWEEMMRTMTPTFHRPSWLSALILVMAPSDLTPPYEHRSRLPRLGNTSEFEGVGSDVERG